MDDLETFLKEIGLVDGDRRLPLKPDETADIVMNVRRMEEDLRSKPGGTSFLSAFGPAFRLMELSSIFDMEKSKAPPEFRKSITEFLNYYITQATEMVESANPQQKALYTTGLKRLVALAMLFGYVYRAMEQDGRWKELTDPPK